MIVYQMVRDEPKRYLDTDTGASGFCNRGTDLSQAKLAWSWVRFDGRAYVLCPIDGGMAEVREYQYGLSEQREIRFPVDEWQQGYLTWDGETVVLACRLWKAQSMTGSASVYVPLDFSKRGILHSAVGRVVCSEEGLYRRADKYLHDGGKLLFKYRYLGWRRQGYPAIKVALK